MNTIPKVSVIIPTYNCARYLPDAIESVLRQTYQDFEIIVIDDGSTDNTKEMLQSYLNKYPYWVKYFYQENGGLACARNAGINNSQGDYIALLDADDMWLPNRLMDGVILFEQQKEVGLAHSNITFISENGNCLNTPDRNKHFLTGYIFESLLLRKAHISCPTVLVRRECFKHLGLFDENLTRLGCEDRELWLRLSRKYKIAYIDKVLAYYRLRQDSMSKNTEKMLEARYYVVNKFFSLNNINIRIKNIALAQIHKEIGDALLSIGIFHESRKQYLKALSFRKFSPQILANFVRSIIKA